MCRGKERAGDGQRREETAGEGGDGMGEEREGREG